MSITTKTITTTTASIHLDNSRYNYNKTTHIQ